MEVMSVNMSKCSFNSICGLNVTINNLFDIMKSKLFVNFVIFWYNTCFVSSHDNILDDVWIPSIAGIIIVKEAGGIVSEIDLSNNYIEKLITSSTDINDKLLKKLDNF